MTPSTTFVKWHDVLRLIRAHVRLTFCHLQRTEEMQEGHNVKPAGLFDGKPYCEVSILSTVDRASFTFVVWNNSAMLFTNPCIFVTETCQMSK